eukprot:COSAG06_NODE_3401_length_5395_cov_41.639539_4_plen_252_part_00
MWSLAGHSLKGITHNTQQNFVNRSRPFHRPIVRLQLMRARMRARSAAHRGGPSAALARAAWPPSWLFTEAPERDGFEGSGWGNRGAKGAAESSDESDASSSDDGSSGSSDASAQAAVLASEGLDRVRAHMRQELVTEAFDPAEGGRTRWRGPRDRQVAESEEHSRVRDTADGGSDPDDSGESGDEEDGLEMQGRIERHKLCPDAAATEQARAMTAAATEQARAMTAAATAMTTHIQAVNAWYKMCVSAPAS